jgi:hypothetical protein
MRDRRPPNFGPLRGASSGLQERKEPHAYNRKRVVVPTSMGAGGFEVLKTRDDVEVISFPPMISSPPDFNALLRRWDGAARKL